MVYNLYYTTHRNYDFGDGLWMFMDYGIGFTQLTHKVGSTGCGRAWDAPRNAASDRGAETNALPKKT